MEQGAHITLLTANTQEVQKVTLMILWQLFLFASMHAHTLYAFHMFRASGSLVACSALRVVADGFLRAMLIIRA